MTRDWCAIDAEGDAGARGLLGVALVSSRRQDYLTDRDAILRALRDEAEAGATFVAFNASYDGSVVFWQLGLDLRRFSYNGRYHHAGWRFSGRKPQAQLWDVRRMADVRSLEDLGAALQLPKYPTPQRALGIDPDRYRWTCQPHGVGECLECYAIRDAEIVYRYAVELSAQCQQWGIDEAPTASAMASQLWLQWDKPQPCGLPNRKIAALSAESYIGGRTEAYEYGAVSPVHVADQASAYAAAMVQVPYPDPARMSYWTQVKGSAVAWEREGVADVEIAIPPMRCGPLPYTDRGLRIYPIGRIRGCWTLHELRYAMSLGCEITHVYRVASSASNLYPFALYVNYLWEQRRALLHAKDPRALYPKSLLNSLYGRLGMADTITARTIREIGGRQPLGGCKDGNIYRIGERLYWDRARPLHFDSAYRNVLWAAQTTAAQRVRLHQLMVAQGEGLLYVDTDSVFSRSKVAGCGTGIGDLREVEQYERGEIYGGKMYALQRYPHHMSSEWWNDPCGAHGRRQCEDCRWTARAGGIPESAALSYLRERVARFDRAITPEQQRQSGQHAGTWIEVTRHRECRPGQRQLTNPGIPDWTRAASPSVPHVIGVP